jgi:hypothetical protein
MEFSPHITHYFPLLIFSVILFYMAGHLFLSGMSQPGETNYRAFLKLLFGQLLVITIYAIIKTKMNTSYLALLFIGVLFISYCRIINRKLFDFILVRGNLKRVEILPIVSILLASFLFYLIQFHKIVDFSGNVHNLYPDRLFYVRVGNLMNATGIETTWNFLPRFAYFFKPSFGHYFEAWNSAFFSWLFDISGQYAMMLIYFPLTFTIVYIACVALIKKYSSIESVFLVYLFSYIIIIIAPLTIRTIASPVVRLFELDTTNKFNLIDDIVQKYSIIYILFIWFLIEFKNSVNHYFIFPLFLAGIIYPILLPGISSSVIIYYICLYLKGRQNKVYLILIIYTVLIFVSFALFYYLNIEVPAAGQPVVSLWSVMKSELAQKPFYFYQVINPLKRILEFTIAFMPYLVLLVFLKDNVKNLLKMNKLILFLLLSVPLLGSDIIYYIFDSHQLFMNIFTPLTNILIFLILVFSFQSGKKFLIIYVCLLIILNIVQTVRNKDYELMTYKLDENEYRPLINDIRKNSFPDLAFLKDSTSRFYNDPIYNLQKISNNLFAEDLYWKPERLTRFGKDEYSDNKYFNGTSFNKYVNKNNLKENIQEARVRFMKEAQIRYLIVSQNYIPDEIISRIIDTTFLLPTQKSKVYRLRIP